MFEVEDEFNLFPSGAGNIDSVVMRKREKPSIFAEGKVDKKTVDNHFRMCSICKLYVQEYITITLLID